MHELAVTESILEIANRHATNAGASKITDIYITLGRLSSIVDDSVQFYWDIISQATLAEGAKLHFTRVPARMHCNDCGQDFDMQDELAPCPNCNSINLKLISGDEFWLESIEIEKESGETV